MAEFVASKLAEAVVSQAVQRITDLLFHEASSLSSVRADVLRLQTELIRMQCFLKDAEKKKEQDERVKNWIAEVRDLACEIEDAIEIYIYKVSSSYIKAFHLRKLRTQINSINDKIKSIGESRQTYAIEFTSSSGRVERTRSLRSLRRSFPDDDEEDEVISMKGTILALKAQLMTEDERRCIVSIVGMGGLGKTTLAKKVYNDVDLKKHFDCSAWVFISQQCFPREVWSDILMQIGFQTGPRENSNQHERRNLEKESLEERKNKREFLKGLQDHELINLMKDGLKDKRYLIVLDDIWRIDAWNSVQSAFPRGNLGSKVVFTTRNEKVASPTNFPHKPPIRPPLLTSIESWELLKRKVFARETFSEADCPSDFEKLGKEMVEKCGGLPLAIVVLGGLLRTKSSLDEWKKVGEHVNSHVISELEPGQQYRVEDILDLSFQDLPYELKSCFLYMGRFPEDSEISKSKLIRLWIAEGFVLKMEGKIMEDIAEQYLGELVDRCMVQVSRMNHTRESVKTCRLHDLMRDFCISKAKEDRFLETMQLPEVNIMMPVSSSIRCPTAILSRRVVIHDLKNLDNPDNLNHVPWVERVHPHLRSLLCHGLNEHSISSLRPKNFTLLRVLELGFHFSGEYCIDAEFPSEIVNLIHLRYLSVSTNGFGNGYVILPTSIVYLRNLQTLDLRGISSSLPWIILRLRCLRHLLVGPYSNMYHGLRMSHVFGNLFVCSNTLPNGNLETLKGIKAKHLLRNKAVHLLTNIRNLDVVGFKKAKEVSLVLESLRLDCLRSLGMKSALSFSFEFPSLELLSKCCVLSRLSLRGKLSQENFSFLPKSLTKLLLEHSTLNQQILMTLEKLPNLRILQLEAIDAELENGVLVCSTDGFPKLEILTIIYVKGLKEWEVEKGSMPILKILNMQYFRDLRVVPEGLKYLTTLRELNIAGMVKEFKERLEGEDFYKVRHIPSISFKEIRTY